MPFEPRLGKRQRSSARTVHRSAWRRRLSSCRLCILHTYRRCREIQEGGDALGRRKDPRRASPAQGSCQGRPGYGGTRLGKLTATNAFAETKHSRSSTGALSRRLGRFPVNGQAGSEVLEGGLETAYRTCKHVCCCAYGYQIADIEQIIRF